MDFIITAATVLTMYYNAINSQKIPFCYNADIEDGVVNRIEVLEEKDKQLTVKMDYNYYYDVEGRLDYKDVRRWNAKRKCWENEVRHVFKYFYNGYNVELCHWNAKENKYDIADEVTLYRAMGTNMTSVRTYRMNEDKSNMRLVSKTIVLEPLEYTLFAEAN